MAAVRLIDVNTVLAAASSIGCSAGAWVLWQQADMQQRMGSPSGRAPVMCCCTSYLPALSQLVRYAPQGADVEPGQRRKSNSSGSRRSSKQHLPMDAMEPSALLHQQVSRATACQCMSPSPAPPVPCTTMPCTTCALPYSRSAGAALRVATYHQYCAAWATGYACISCLSYLCSL